MKRTATASLSVSLRVSLLLGVTSLAPAVSAQATNLPISFGLKDNNTVSLFWDTIGPNIQPTTAVVSPWFKINAQGQPDIPWTFTGAPLSSRTIANKTGFGLQGSNQSIVIEEDTDNEKRNDHVKVFEMRFDFNPRNGTMTPELLKPSSNTRLRNIRRTVTPLAIGSGWRRMTFDADIDPQPANEVFRWSLTTGSSADGAIIDDVYENTHCELNKFFQDDEPLGFRTGFRVDVQAASGNANCFGTAHSFHNNQESFWVSAGTPAGQRNKLFQFSRQGQLLRTYDQPIVPSVPGARGMRDLAVDESGPFIYGGQEADAGGVSWSLFCFDVTTGVFDPNKTVKVSGLPQGFIMRALAFNPFGEGGQGTFWTSDFGGQIYEISRNTGAVIRNAQSGTSNIYGMGFDRIRGMLYFFSQATQAGDPRNVRVVGTQYEVAYLRPTGVKFYGDMSVSGSSTGRGGIAGGMDAYHLPSGQLRFVCLSQATSDTIYELAGPFQYGFSCGGGIRMNGVPFQGNQNFEMVLHGVNGARSATLFLGMSRSQMASIQLPAALDGLGLTNCSVLASLDIEVGNAQVNGNEARLRVPLPAIPALHYMKTYWQWVYLDAQANSRGLALSPGGETVIY